MNAIRESLIVIISLLIGASLSAIITIVIHRPEKPYHKILYSAKFWTLILMELIFSLLFILGFFKN